MAPIIQKSGNRARMAFVNLLNSDVLWVVVAITPGMNMYLGYLLRKLSLGVKNCKIDNFHTFQATFVILLLA